MPNILPPYLLYTEMLSPCTLDLLFCNAFWAWAIKIGPLPSVHTYGLKLAGSCLPLSIPETHEVCLHSACNCYGQLCFFLSCYHMIRQLTLLCSMTYRGCITDNCEPCDFNNQTREILTLWWPDYGLAMNIHSKYHQNQISRQILYLPCYGPKCCCAKKRSRESPELFKITLWGLQKFFWIKMLDRSADLLVELSYKHSLFF